MKWKNGVKPFADSNNQLHYIAACKYQPTPTPFYSLLFFSLAPNSPSSIHSLYFLSPHLLPHFRQILDWNRRSNANATPPRSLLEGTQTVTAISLFFALLASEAAMSVSLRSVRFFLLWLCKLRSNRAWMRAALRRDLLFLDPFSQCEAIRVDSIAWIRRPSKIR